MRLVAPFRVAGEHVEVELLPGAHALFTTRRGGVSVGPFASLNLGRLTDDEPAAVTRNRALLERRLGIELSYVRQVHGDRVVLVARGAVPVGGSLTGADGSLTGAEGSLTGAEGSLTARGATGADEARAEADGQATVARGVALTVLSADCLPIALAARGAVAMLHAGWRGLAAGVLAEGVRSLRELGAPDPIVAAIGPAAGPCCYEVGDHVRAAFTEHGAVAQVGNNLHLGAIAAAQLRKAGVAEIHDVDLCTICSDPALFFSHRRDQGITGRQAGLAWLS